MNRTIGDDELLEVLRAVRDREGNQASAARDLGLTRNQFTWRLVQARTRALDRQPVTAPARTLPRRPAQELDIPTAPDGDEPIADLIARKKAHYGRDQESEAFNKIIRVGVKSAGPVAICAVGDPHVDDDKCDIGAIERDMTIIGQSEGMYALHVGDITNNWVGRLGRLYAHQNTSAADAIRISKWMFDLAPPIAVVGGNHDCHDTETEALTHRGWRGYADIRADDQVLSFIPETGGSEWAPILDRVVREHDGDMIEIATLALSARMTPGHRVLHKKRTHKRWSEWSYTTADDMPHRTALPVSAVCHRPDADIEDDWLRLCGWVLTDGCISHSGGSPRVTLYQSKDTSEIERLLSALGLEHTHAVRHRDITHVCGRKLVKPPLPCQEFRLTAEASRRVLVCLPDKKQVPPVTPRLSTRQFDVLLDAIVAGDGTWDGSQPEARRVAVVHGARPFLESLQASAVQHGWYARISVARGKDLRLNLCRRESIQFEKAQAVRVASYKGTVWCLTVPRGNFMVRRKGSAHFSGNCWNEGMNWLAFVVKQAGCNILQAHGVRLQLNFPKGQSVRIHTRHDFPGHSQYNPIHGLRKEHLFGLRDHVNIAGHKHIDAYSVVPSPEGYMQHMLRVSGYKAHDDYAKQGNFQPMKMAPTCALVIDPLAKNPAELIKPFWCLETAADYLKFKRTRA